MNQEFERGWYVIYVRYRYEKKVNNSIQNFYFESYLPLVQKEKKWSDRKKIIYEPLFPSYVFVYIEKRIDFSKIITIDGVCNFVRFDKKIARVKDHEIEGIKILLNGGYEDVEAISTLPKVGEIRTIRFGVLRGRDCEVLRINNVNKIIVRVGSINMNIMATLPVKYLERRTNNHLS